MKLLTLGDLEGKSEKEILAHIVESWKVDWKELRGVHLLVAYESVGDYGCDSAGFYVFRKGRKLYEVHGSHCSCYGFENQWSPEATSLAFLRSKHLHFPTGGYDTGWGDRRQQVRDFFAIKPRASKSGSLSDQPLSNENAYDSSCRP